MPGASNFVIRASSFEGALAQWASRFCSLFTKKVQAGQVHYWSGQVNKIGHLPFGQVARKVKFYPWLTPENFGLTLEILTQGSETPQGSNLTLPATCPRASGQFCLLA